MTRDFTLKTYQSLLKALKEKNFKFLTVEKYFEKTDISNNFIILRHDVDKYPDAALRMAKIEKDANVFSTYYFRVMSNSFDEKIIKKIHDMGHEIGYHYETLDEAGGDIDLAYDIFCNKLKKLRKTVSIRTICMHGNSVSPWENIDLWKKYDFSKLKIVGEAYLSIPNKNLTYLTDTGRDWNGKYAIKDYFNKEKNNLEIKNTVHLIRLVGNESFQDLYLNTHPGRWNDSFISWSRELVLQKIKNVGKSVIKRRRLQKYKIRE